MSEFFKEYTHLVADPRKPWPYFDIPGCLKRLSWSVRECYGRITPQWIDEHGLTHHAVVQLALYTCQPFHDIPPGSSASEGYIIDEPDSKNSGKKPRKYLQRLNGGVLLCRNVRSLVEALATALMHYESWCEYVYGWPTFQEQGDACVTYLKNLQYRIRALRRRGAKRKNPMLYHRRNVEKDLESAITIIQAVTYEDYQRSGAPTDTPGDPRAHSNKYMLLKDMDNAFRTYGPEKWTQAATHRALAAIMNQMQIKNADGKEWKPNSIKQLLKRGLDPRLKVQITLTRPKVVPWYTRPE
jgi:hypothetical protein